MDLQIKLVNDGYAATHSSERLQWLPEWAQWRQQAFGFTSERAVIVYNKKLLKGKDIPQNRFELIELLRDQTQRFKGRIGTYDIQRSGLGYLFASQDAQQIKLGPALLTYQDQMKKENFLSEWRKVIR